MRTPPSVACAWSATTPRRPKHTSNTTLGAVASAVAAASRSAAITAASTEARAVTHTTLSLVEAGRQLSLDALVAVQLARALGVEVEWLVTGEGRRERTRR